MAQDTPKRPRGRPKGSINKVNAIRSARAAEGGVMPSEGMLALGRFCQAVCKAYQPKKLDDGTLQWNAEARSEFKDFAKLAVDAFGKAAPYLEYRLAAMTITHKHMDLSELTDAEFRTIETVIERAAKPGSGEDREGKTRH